MEHTTLHKRKSVNAAHSEQRFVRGGRSLVALIAGIIREWIIPFDSSH